jgi:hypothetical protein
LSSADCEREAITIDPPVSGQQLIASLDDEGGNAVRMSSRLAAFVNESAGPLDELWRALQQACASLVAGIAAMEGCADCCVSMSATALRA